MIPKKPEKQEIAKPKSDAHSDKVYIHAQRDWKEYLGESILIIFSVLLALVLTEYINSINEKKKRHDILKNIVAELNHNKTSIQEMQQYNLLVLKKIDSALISAEIQKRLVDNDEFHLKVIAPEGVLYRYVDNEAWTIAKGNNIMSEVNYKTVVMLTKVYEDQGRLMKLEEEAAKVILDRPSRDPKQVHSTLILIRDIYHGWAVDRSNGLVSQIDDTIKKIEEDL